MPNPVYISQITLPNGNSTITLNFADATARQALAGGLSFNVCYDGSAAPVVANIPAGVVVNYQGTEYTGTMLASAAAALTFYLVKEGETVEGMDVYAEYVPITENSTKKWEKIGDTQFDFSSLKALAFKDNVVLEKGAGVNVLGEDIVIEGADSEVTFSGGHSTDSVLGANTTLTGQDSNVTITGTQASHVLGADTTFEAADSSVVFSGDHTTDEVLGANATFTTEVTPTTTNLKATASGFAVASDGNDASVLTGVSSSDDAFVDQLDVTTHKMKTINVYPVASTEEVSAVSESHANLETTSVPVVSSVGEADTWAFSYVESVANSGNFDTLEISGANGTALSLASTNATVATGATGVGGDAVVTGMTISNKTVAVASEAPVAVATGAIGTDNDEGTGATLVTDVDYDTDDALTDVESDGNEASALTGVSVTQPSIALSTGSAVSGETVEFVNGLGSNTVVTEVDDDDAADAITALASAQAQAQAISVNDEDDVEAVTSVGTAVAAGQAITVGSNDLVDAITGLASASAEAQTISITTADTVKVADYDDLDVSVS